MDSLYGGMRLEEFLRAVAARQPAPGGGAATALVVAMSAGLVAMAGRFSEASLDDSVALVREAEHLQARAMALAEEDARAYGGVIEAYALPRDDGQGRRRDAIRTALRRAADTPLQMARAARDVAMLAVQVLDRGNTNLAGDAYAAVLLVSAAARSAALLVRINVDAGQLERNLVNRVAEHVGSVAEATNRANVLVNGGNGERIDTPGGRSLG